MKKPKTSKPKSILTVKQFRQQFGDEENCWQHLTQKRWPDGFVCPRCGGGSRGYMKARRVHECRQCGYQGSVTAGTIFHKTRVRLQDWFWALYRMSQDKKGISALQLSKELGVSYPTAWLMQHKIRQAMADRDQGYQLKGLIEVDEGDVGSAEGKQQKGRGAETKSVVAVAVEHRGPGKEDGRPIPGFAALWVVEDAGASSLQGFIRAKIKAGSTILTDGRTGYSGLGSQGFEHVATVLRGAGKMGHHLFPWVHVTLSNLKRFLLGTHHKVEPKHMKRYVAEFTYRLNRRSMETNLFERLIHASLNTNTITYNSWTATPKQA